jgi:hypothetical protein
MDNELGSEIGITTERLNNAWREDLLSDFDDFEASIWSKWTVAMLMTISNHDMFKTYEGFRMMQFPVMRAGMSLPRAIMS